MGDLTQGSEIQLRGAAIQLGNIGCISMLENVHSSVERSGWYEVVLCCFAGLLDALGQTPGVISLSMQRPPPSCPAQPPAARGALGWGRRVKGDMRRVSPKAEEAGRQPGAAPYKEMGLAAWGHHCTGRRFLPCVGSGSRKRKGDSFAAGGEGEAAREERKAWVHSSRI